jgi:radical SAM-linked protein
VSEVRQRWRLVFARDEEARFLSHLDAVRLWERALRRGRIPMATSEGFSPRPRLVFAAPLPLGMLAEHELADLFLAERLTAQDLRARLAAGMPAGYRVLDLHDVWTGAPALAPQLAAADYRLTLLSVDRAALEGAAARLLAADRLPRERHKGERTTPYDLRPLLLDLRARDPDRAALTPDDAVAKAAGLWMRLRHSQDGGSGRAGEVVAALAEDMGLAADVADVAVEDTGDGEPPERPRPEEPPELPAKARPGKSAGGLRATRPGESAEQPGPRAGRPALEIVRPVRERLWLAEELSD